MSPPPTDPQTQAPPPAYPIASVSQALRTLALLSEIGTLRGDELSRRLAINDAAAAELLDTLSRHGYVEHTHDGSYRFGTAMIELGLAVLGELDLPGLLRPLMREAAAQIQETVELCVRLGPHVVIVDLIEPTRPVFVRRHLGARLPTDTSAPGLALRATFNSRPTPTDDAIRARGFAVDDGDTHPDVTGVAAALSNPSGTVRATLGIEAPRERMTTSRTRDAGRILREACARAGAALDHHAHPEPHPSPTPSS